MSFRQPTRPSTARRLGPLVLPRLLRYLPLFLLFACDSSVDTVSNGRDAAADASDDMSDDSGADTGSDAATDPVPETAAVFVLGDPCYEKDQRGCAGFDSDAQLLCRNGRWIAASTCPAGQRCDTRLGPEQGQCALIVPACADRAGLEEYCDGATRLSCGADRITVGMQTCPPQEVCAAAEGVTSCVLDPTDECAMGLDDCDDDPDACVDVLGGFMCICPPYYEGNGRGPDGCTDVLECSIDHGGCHALATCNEVVGAKNTCTCPSGYLGNGEGELGCVNEDECAPGAVAACGLGAIACADLAGSYECTCDAAHAPGADKRSCVARAWKGFTSTELPAPTAFARDSTTGEAVMAAATVNRTMRVAYYAAGSGWSEVVESGPGDTAAANGSNVVATYVGLLGNYSAMSTSWHSQSAGWETFLVSDPGPEGHVSEGRSVIDAGGNIIAIWERLEPISDEHLWARQYSVQSGWGEPFRLDTNNPGQPHQSWIVMNERGDALVTWLHNLGRLTARYYSSTAGWGEPTFLGEDEATFHSYDATAALSPNGLAYVVWQSFNKYEPNSEIATWARRFDPKSGWSEPESVAGGLPGAVAINDVGKVAHAVSKSIGIDRDGNALEVYEQGGNAWVRRFANESWQTPVKLADAVGAPLISVAPDGSAMVVGRTAAGKLWYGFYE